MVCRPSGGIMYLNYCVLIHEEIKTGGTFMIALKLTKIKESMAKLLLSDTFDNFLFMQGEIVTFNTFTIDGYLRKEFYDSDNQPEREFSLWGDMREYCYSVIKGNRTPLRFSIVLGLSDENVKKLLTKQELPYNPSDVKGLYLNIRYDGNALICTTGTSLNLFTMDKSLEQTWDKMVQKFFVQKELDVEIIA